MRAVFLFALGVFAVVGMLFTVILVLSIGEMSLDIVAMSLLIALYTVPVPAFIWGMMLRYHALGGGFLRGRHPATLAVLAALCGLPAFALIYYLSIPPIRLWLDPMFDQLGFFFAFALLGATTLLIIFPFLSLFLKKLAPKIGVGELFPSGGNGA